MKTKRTLFLLPALIAVLNLIPVGRMTAQTPPPGPQLKINFSGNAVVLAWPADFQWLVANTTFTTYDLQYTTNLVSPVGWVDWSAPAPVIVNGNKVVSIPSFGTQVFFRLSRRTHGTITCHANVDCSTCNGTCFGGFPLNNYCTIGLATNGEPYPCSR